MWHCIPSTVKVGGHTYTVQRRIWEERDDVDGQTLHRLRLIRLDGRDPDPRDTLVHEILHVIDYVYNAGQLDEGTVRRLGEGIYQVLRDNPVWVRSFLPKARRS